ncbi:MAG: hypothetical protein JW850_04565 [Thermoflexales bacterium]|nr:hypothetical protein [Thermoflexales bacterium]
MFSDDFGTGTDMGLGGLVLTIVVIVGLIVLAGLALGPGLQNAVALLGPLAEL